MLSRNAPWSFAPPGGSFPRTPPVKVTAEGENETLLPFSPSPVALRQAAVRRPCSPFEDHLPEPAERVALTAERSRRQTGGIEQPFEIGARVSRPLPGVGVQLD